MKIVEIAPKAEKTLPCMEQLMDTIVGMEIPEGADFYYTLIVSQGEILTLGSNAAEVSDCVMQMEVAKTTMVIDTMRGEV